MSNSVPDDHLKAWITELRARLERGEFVDTPPVDLGYGTGPLPAEGTIRIMLAELDDTDSATPEDREDPARVAVRVQLFKDFRQLRALMG